VSRSLVVVAPLSRGAGKAAEALIAAGPPFDLASTGVTSHSVYLSGGEAVFVFEGAEDDLSIDALGGDPDVSAAFARWAPLLASAPRVAQERYCWTSSSRPRSSA
jgi:hypothetical protein